MDISLLAKQLEREDPAQYELQKSALTVLIDSPTSEAIDVLLNVVNHYENSVLLSLAMSVLAKIRSTEAIAALVHLSFEHPEAKNRSEAARALGYTHSERALAPLKKLLSDGLSNDDLPVLEALWAVANLCQAEILKRDEEWESLINKWQERGGEYNIMARHIRICWDGQIIIS